MVFKQEFAGLALLMVASAQAGAAPGDAWFDVVPAADRRSFDVEVLVDAAGARVGAYQVTLAYDAAAAQVDSTAGSHAGASVGSDGFIAGVSTRIPGKVVVNGFDVLGRAGSDRMHMATVHFVGDPASAGKVRLVVDALVDEQGRRLRP